MNTETFPPSVLTKRQVKTFGPKPISGYGPGGVITATVRYDDQCGNGHNTFSITAEVRTNESRRRNDIQAGGCMHEEIARHFPELAPLIKWHLTSSDGPMHYPSNVTYLAGNLDHWGLAAGEFRQHTSRGPRQNSGVEGVPHWELYMPEGQETQVYSMGKPAPVTVEWRASGITGDGKKRELGHARSGAVWPEATDEQLCLPKAELEALLMARLPALMADFKTAVESLGFTY
jgi:hypothetical protein